MTKPKTHTQPALFDQVCGAILPAGTLGGMGAEGVAQAAADATRARLERVLAAARATSERTARDHAAAAVAESMIAGRPAEDFGMDSGSCGCRVCFAERAARRRYPEHDLAVTASTAGPAGRKRDGRGLPLIRTAPVLKTPATVHPPEATQASTHSERTATGARGWQIVHKTSGQLVKVADPRTGHLVGFWATSGAVDAAWMSLPAGEPLPAPPVPTAPTPSERTGRTPARTRRPRLDLTCPTCKTPGALTPHEARRRYQCASCADHDEGVSYGF